MNPGIRFLAALLALAGAPAFAASAPQVARIHVAPEVPVEPVQVRIPRYTLKDKEREIIAACLVLEAASQGDFGMRGVMSVIRNRARGLPELFAPVVLRPKQFSALNKIGAGRETIAQVIARAKRDRMWPVALRVVDDAVLDTWHDSTGGATHYTRTGERTPWTRSLANTVTIGSHAFYR